MAAVGGCDRVHRWGVWEVLVQSCKYQNSIWS